MVYILHTTPDHTAYYPTWPEIQARSPVMYLIMRQNYFRCYYCFGDVLKEMFLFWVLCFVPRALFLPFFLLIQSETKQGNEKKKQLSGLRHFNCIPFVTYTRSFECVCVCVCSLWKLVANGLPNGLHLKTISNYRIFGQWHGRIWTTLRLMLWMLSNAGKKTAIEVRRRDSSTYIMSNSRVEILLWTGNKSKMYTFNQNKIPPQNRTKDVR